MKIRQLDIHNFRGIKSLSCNIPADQRLLVLVGPGDSGKSTVLDAIHYLLGDRWNISVSDTDFHNVNVAEPIVIKAVLTDIPEKLRKDDSFGLWLSGLSDDGVLHQDPEDEHSPALIVSLTIDESLEPQWAVERTDGRTHFLSSRHRKHFSTFKVDERNDTQLRWSRTSALGRMSAEEGADRHALSAASRAAQQALASHDSKALNDLATKVQAQVNAIGGGSFSGIKPGLDTSRSSSGAGLALYENVVPLTSFGLGSKRLASLAVQQLAAGNRAIAVIDELENGLEPHRAVQLLNYLNNAQDYSQVIITTHSPVIVEQAQIDKLATVHNSDGAVEITPLAGSSKMLQRLRRGRPSSLLARRIIVAEGKTEHGILLACLEQWDKERIAEGCSTSGGEGVTIQDGQGGSEVAPRTESLRSLGYAVLGFMDNDDRTIDRAVTRARQSGAEIVQWEKGFNTESQICSGLNHGGLNQFLALGSERRSGDDTVLGDLTSIDPTSPVKSLNVESWLAAGMMIEQARSRIAQAAHRKSWFKEVNDGRALGEWLLENRDEPALQEVSRRLDEVYAFVYPLTEPISVCEDSEEMTTNG